ncbi:MAG: AAA family ATPase [Bacillota bacterium]|nr:AAA family ATPase [Bacillota bacterium]
MDNIKIIIAEVMQEQRNNIINILSNVEYIKIVGEADSTEEIFRKLEEKEADVILIGANASGDGYKVSEKVNAEYPEAAVIIIEEEFKEEIIHKALFSGAKDVLVSPFTPAKLVDTIYRAHELLKKKLVIHRESTVKLKKQSHLGEVITMFSTKGGVGKTFLATNLAVALQKQSGKRVVLVDLDLDFGNDALALNIVPKFTISDVVDDIKNIDQDLIESYLIPHESGIMILPSNGKPQISEFINADHIEIILRTLQKSFDYIIIDMPARFYEPVNPAFVVADKLFLVTTPEVSTIKNIKTALITLNDLNYPKSKIRIILNRADSKGLIKAKDVETTLNENIYGVINFDYKTAITCLNEGIPVALKNVKSGMGKEFMDLAKNIIHDSEVSADREGEWE